MIQAVQSLARELRFLRHLVTLNFISAMEYRASFLTQIFGMFFNNAIYLVFWLIFFGQFGAINGYVLDDIFLLFAVVAFSVGLATLISGNVAGYLAHIIAEGRLDYYMTLPRPLLVHVICSRMSLTALGDVLFGLLAIVLYGRFDLLTLSLYFVTVLLAAAIFSGFAVTVGALAFFIGNAEHTSTLLSNSMVTLALYPNSLFSGGVRLLLFTLLPSAFIGAVPVDIIRYHDVSRLLQLLLAAVVVWVVATAAFYGGLRRYESGNRINVVV